VWSGFTWLMTGTSGRLWWMQWWTFRFWCHRVSWLVSKHIDTTGLWMSPNYVLRNTDHIHGTPHQKTMYFYVIKPLRYVLC
jgi:hypothetical protein